VGPTPGAHQHARAEIRIEVDAAALFSLTKALLSDPTLSKGGRRRPFGHGRVRNISAGGVEISDPQPRLEVGARVKIGIVSADVRLGPLQAEVVRDTEAGIALRFLDMDAATRSQILRELTRL
jgi:hypothetical protein